MTKKRKNPGKTLITIANVILVIMCVLAIIMMLAYAYLHYIVKPKTIGVNYINDSVPVNLVEKADELTEERYNYLEDRKLFNINYYSNDKGNGEELQELRLDYFTDTSLSVASCRETGMQYLGNYENLKTNWFSSSSVDSADKQAGEYVSEAFTYYDAYDGISYEGGKVAKQLNRDAKLIIKIDNKPYLLQLTGHKDIYKTIIIINQLVAKLYYTYENVFLDCINAVKTNSKGYGDFYITLDLSNYFTVYAFNEQGQAIEDNITTDIFTYAVCKVHYDENGMKNATQSMFGQINGDKNYGKQSEVNTEYWQSRMVYTIDESMLAYRFSEQNNGYYAYASEDLKELFASMPRSEVNIEININSAWLSSKNYNLIGLDYSAFENMNVNSLVLRSSRNTNFNILSKAIYGTKITTFNKDSTITLSIASDAIEEEYKEVLNV